MCIINCGAITQDETGAISTLHFIYGLLAACFHSQHCLLLSGAAGRVGQLPMRNHHRKLTSVCVCMSVRPAALPNAESGKELSGSVVLRQRFKLAKREPMSLAAVKQTHDTVSCWWLKLSSSSNSVTKMKNHTQYLDGQN